MSPAATVVRERHLVSRIATVRVIFALVNFAIVWMDPNIPSAGPFASYGWAFGGAGLFALYAFAIRWLVGRSRIAPSDVLAATPFLDVFFASVLITVTEGYLSAFAPWLFFAVVCAGFCLRRHWPLYTALFAAAAYSAIALIPEPRQFEVDVFAVRTLYLFGVVAVLSMFGALVAAQAQTLDAVVRDNRRLADAGTIEAVVELLLARVREQMGCEAVRFRPAGHAATGEAAPGHSPVCAWPLALAGDEIGTLLIYRGTPPTHQEETFLHLVCDRAVAAITRLRLSEQLIVAAKEAERLRLTDELHDGYLQTLVALDLRAEAARHLIEPRHQAVRAELDAIQQIAHQAVQQARGLLNGAIAAAQAGPERLAEIIRARWPENADVRIDADVHLPAERWRAIEMLLKEGLNNARKHARAERVWFRVERTEDGRTVCSLRNDGSARAGPVRAGYGLTRLRSIVESQGGRLAFEPQATGGAVLRAEFNGAEAEVTATTDRRVVVE